MKHSEACERNKGPILEKLEVHFRDRNKILEIGSGTGQHAVYFAKNLSHLTWYTSDLKENLPDLNERISSEGEPNVELPLELDVTVHPWPLNAADGVFTANTLHIMPWAFVPDFFTGTGKVLKDGGVLCIYGPFKYKGKFTSDSNKDFDGLLKSKNTESGIRDFEEVNKLALDQGFRLVSDYSMPANNQLIVWEK